MWSRAIGGEELATMGAHPQLKHGAAPTEEEGKTETRKADAGDAWK